MIGNVLQGSCVECVGFGVNHKERDSRLSLYRTQLMEEIEKDLLKDENVIAVFYGGSIAEGSTDAYSDIDLRIVIKDEAFETYRKNKTVRPKKWGNVLFFEDLPLTSYAVAHYDCFIKVDTFYYKIEDVSLSIWLKDIQIVRDTGGIIAKVREQSESLKYEPSIEDIKLYRTKIFAHSHEVYRRVMRNEMYYALHSLDSIRNLVTSFWYMEAGIQPNAMGNWSKIEGKYSKLNQSQLKLLESWDCGREPERIRHVLKDMLKEFVRVHKGLCNKLHFEENRDWIDKILGQIW